MCIYQGLLRFEQRRLIGQWYQLNLWMLAFFHLPKVSNGTKTFFGSQFLTVWRKRSSDRSCFTASNVNEWRLYFQPILRMSMMFVVSEYVSAAEDNLMYSYLCPTYVNEYERVYQSQEVEELVKPHRNLFTYLSEHTGFEMTRVKDVFFLYHTLEAEVRRSCAYRDHGRNRL